MASTNQSTGGAQLTGGPNAGHLAGVGAQIAAGVPVSSALKNVLKDSALDTVLGPTALFAGGLVGALKTMKAIVDQSGLLERGFQRIAGVQQIQGKFETLLKSTEKATTRLKELYRFAASAPFNFQDLAEANRILETLTHGALSGARGMKLVGDAAAASGQSFSDTAEQVGKLYNALRSGRSIERVILNLQMTGVVTDELVGKLELAQSTGQGFAASWGLVEKALAGAEGGMQNEMKTVGGLTARLENASRVMEQAFGEPFMDVQTKAIENTIKATENLTPVLAQVAQDSAPLLTFFSRVKNEIALSTLATKGFASALQIAWIGAKGLAVGTAAGVGASMLSNLGKSVGSAVDFATRLAGNRRIVTGYSRARGELRRSNLLDIAANQAFNDGGLLRGAALKGMAWRDRAGVALGNLHRTSTLQAKTSEGGTNIAQYAITAGTQLALGGVNLLKKGIMGAGTALLGLARANPITALIVTLGAGAKMLYDWREKAIAATNAQLDFLHAIARTNAEANSLVNGVKNLDDWRIAAAALAAGLSEVKEKMKAIDVNDPNFAKNLRTLSLSGLRLHEQQKVLDKKLPGVGASQAEKARFVAESEGLTQLQAAQRQSVADRGDDYSRRAFLKADSFRLGHEAELGKSISASIDRPEAFKNRPTELMGLNTTIAGLEGHGVAVPRHLYERQAQLAKLADTHQEKAAQKISTDTELQALDNKIQLKELELVLDKRIAAVQAAGGETATEEAGKQVILLQKQLELAKAQGRTLDAKDIQTQLAGLAAGRAYFRGQRGIDRARDNAQINQNPRAAQAADDFAERQKLRDQYEAAGLTAVEADKDFKRHQMAQAAQTLPRFGADSLQSIGGGGGAYASSPMVAAQMRANELSTRQIRLLEIIAGNSGGPVLE